MENILEFSTVEEIQKAAFKSQILQNIMEEEIQEKIDFQNLDNIQEFLDDYYNICVYNGNLEISSDFEILDEGGIYYIDGDFIINGDFNSFGAAIFCVNGSLIADSISFCDGNYIIEKDLITKKSIYLRDTSLELHVKGNMNTPIIYSSLSDGILNIPSLDSNTKGIIIKDSYSILGDISILETLGIKDIIIQKN